MAGVIDTNILLYAANRDAREHSSAVAFLRSTAESGAQWFLTEGIIYEFLRVATHPRVFAQPLSWQEALDFIVRIVEHPAFLLLTAQGRHWSLLGDLLAELTFPAGNLFFDVRTAVLMREHGILEIYTADTDFLQMPEIKVINPLK
jgi:uncharacterized protein